MQNRNLNQTYGIIIILYYSVLCYNNFYYYNLSQIYIVCTYLFLHISLITFSGKCGKRVEKEQLSGMIH